MRTLLLLAAMTSCGKSDTAQSADTTSAGDAAPAHHVAATPDAKSTGVANEDPLLLKQCPEDLSPSEGRLVTLTGIQTRSKIPTVCGVDVDGDDELADKLVEVSGKIERYEVAPLPPDAPQVATRGPGTYFGIVDNNGKLATTTPR